MFNKIIKPTLMPTAIGINIKFGKGNKYKNKIPTTEVSKWLKKTFFGLTIKNAGGRRKQREKNNKETWKDCERKKKVKNLKVFTILLSQ